MKYFYKSSYRFKLCNVKGDRLLLSCLTKFFYLKNQPVPLFVLPYDNNGNMTSITNGCGTTTYTWDVRNRLVGIDGFNPDCSPLSALFKYDALGKRIEKTINGRTIQYLYDGLDIVQEIENGQVTVNYIRTLNIDEPLARLAPDALRFYQTDALGSVIALTLQLHKNYRRAIQNLVQNGLLI